MTSSDSGTTDVRAFDRSGLLLAIATALVGLLYGLLRATALTPDSLVYASEIRDGAQFLNPHHLLFASIIHGVWAATGLDVVTAAQLHNIFWSMVAVLAARRLFSALLADRGAATWIAAALAAAAGFAGFATQVEAYVPSLACTLTAFALLAGGGEERARIACIFAAGGALALAILYHQGAVLAAVALPFLPVASRTRRERVGVRAAVLGVAGIATSAAYLAAFAATRENGLGGFLRYCFYYAAHDRPGWGTFDNVDAKGLHLLADSQLRSLVHLPGDEFTTWSYVGSITFTVGMAFVVWRLLRAARRDRALRAAFVFLAAWAIVPWLFVLWWLPREEEYLIATTPAVLAAINMATFARSTAPRRLAWLTLAAVAAWNLGTAIIPRHLDAGDDARTAAALANAADDRTVVLCGFPVFGNYLFHRHPGRPLLVDDPFLALYANRDAPRTAIESASKVLVPWRLIDPRARTYHFSALTDADGWLRVIGWVCDLQRSDAGTNVSHAAVSRLETPSGAILCVEPAVRRTGDLADLLDELDRLAPEPGDRFRSVVR